jgi:hypothetical protein
VTRWNGKPDLTAIQLQEKKRRRMLDRRMRWRVILSEVRARYLG